MGSSNRSEVSSPVVSWLERSNPDSLPREFSTRAVVKTIANNPSVSYSTFLFGILEKSWLPELVSSMPLSSRPRHLEDCLLMECST